MKRKNFISGKFKLSNQILLPGVYIGFVKCVDCNKLTQKIVVVN